jgi:hypothetical protein
MSDSPLLPYVHPALVYRREELAHDLNALSLWRAANEGIVDEEEIWRLFFARSECVCGEPDCLACNFNQQEVLARLTAILRLNEGPLRLLEQCLLKPSVPT